jgi:hypothetical protein
VAHCPKCHAVFEANRWYRTGGGRYGSVETRCNQCDSAIKVFVPWPIWLGLGPVLPLLALVVLARSGAPKMLFALGGALILGWMVMAPKVLYHWFGCVVLLNRSKIDRR